MFSEQKVQTPANGRAVDELLSVEGIFRSFRRQVWWIVALTLAGIVAAGAWASSQTKIYRARSIIELNPKPPTPLGKGVDAVVELGSGNYWANREYFSTQRNILESRSLARLVVDELNLANDEGFLRNEPGARVPSEPVSRDDAVDVLRSRLIVLPIKDTRLFEVSFDDADPERARRTLEAMVRAYLDNNVDSMLSSTSSAVEWLTKQSETLRKDLDESELALHQYKLKKAISSIGIDEQATMLRGEMEQLTAARTEARAHVIAARSRVQQLSKIDETKPLEIPRMDLFELSSLKELQASYFDVAKAYDALVEEGKGSRHPLVLAMAAKLDTSRRALVSELKSVRAGAERDLAALEQEEAGLHQLVRQAERTALDLNLMQIEYGRLRRTKDNNEKLYGLVLERTKETGLTRMLKVNNIQVVDAAFVSSSPVRPRVGISLALGAALGMFAGLGVGLFRERADKTLKSPAEIEQKLGFVPLGAIPQLTVSSLEKTRSNQGFGRGGRRGRAKGLERAELCLHDAPKSSVAEAVRAIRTNLLFMAPDTPFRTIVVTSANPSEGKTTVTCCLAIAMAQAGRRVLIVDSDLRKPRLHRVFSHPDGRSRSQLSRGLLAPEELDFSDLNTEVPNLFLLEAGPIPPNPSELLHSGRFEQFLERAKAHFDFILFDSPPLVVTDAAIIAPRVDAVIVVARAGETPRNSVAAAGQLLVSVGGRLAGVILNALDPKQGGYGYGYGYGQGYGVYGETEQKPSERTTSEV